jgi:SAM-dependent methyltransferase
MSPMEPDTTSRATLSTDAYVSDKHLAARQSLYRWQTPTYDLPGIVADLLPNDAGIVLDVGCGNGMYLRRLRTDRPDLTTIGIDISTGIIRDLDRPLVVADAARLPAAPGTASAVLAMHMLYHLEDVHQGVVDLADALAPGGQLIASTNSRHDKAELDQLWATAAAEVLDTDQPPLRVSLSAKFPLEAAPDVLSRHFTEVEVVEQHGVIAITTSDPVIEHLASYRTWAAQSGVPFDAVLQRARAILDHHIHHHGAFAITTHAGILRCRMPAS